MLAGRSRRFATNRMLKFSINAANKDRKLKLRSTISCRRQKNKNYRSKCHTNKKLQKKKPHRYVVEYGEKLRLIIGFSFSSKGQLL